MPSHNALYQNVIDALEALYNDMSVPASVTDADLQRIMDNIAIMRMEASSSGNVEEEKHEQEN